MNRQVMNDRLTGSAHDPVSLCSYYIRLVTMYGWVLGGRNERGTGHHCIGFTVSATAERAFHRHQNEHQNFTPFPHLE